MPWQLTRARIILITFVILATEPFAYAATRSWFWQGEYLMAPIATALYLLVVGAFALGRYRWTWVILSVFCGTTVVTWGFDSRRFASWYVLGFAINVVTFALLVSSPMRDRLRRPVGIRQRGAHLSRG